SMIPTLHVISHTHWDREWYLPFQSFRMMLVDNIDRVLDLLETDPGFRAFHLDGQTVVLEDYLEIRPQNRTRLERQIQAGRLIVGPFYLLNDQWLVSAESIVRNLLLGRKICREFGTDPMPVGYVADNFGHHSQVPQILAGFGLDNAILGRGITPDSVGGKSEFIWEGADGTRILTHLMAGWYNSAYNFPDDVEGAVRYAQEVEGILSKFASAPLYLGMDGCDHLFARPWLTRIFPEVNKALEGRFEVRHSTMGEFMAELRKSVPDDLVVRRGELREEKHATVVQGTLSAHPEIKQRNIRSQMLLERHAEPLATVNWMCGGSYDADFLWKAWRFVLQNHPHDSICGCSVNQVHRDMIPRFDAADDIAGNLAGRGLQQLALSLRGSMLAEGDKVLLLFNPASRPRRGPLRLKVLYPLRKFSGHTEKDNSASGEREDLFEPFALVDAQGREIPCQVLSRRFPARKRRTSPHMLPDQRQAVEFDLVLEDVSLPAFGYQTLSWVYRPAPPLVSIGAPPFEHRPARVSHISNEPHLMENESLRVEINPDGSLNLTDKATGWRLERTHYFEDGGDAGQSYDYFKPKRDVIVTSLGVPAHIALLHNGPTSAEYEVRLEMLIPACKDGDGRSADRVPLKIRTVYSLARGQKFLGIRTTLDNSAQDHRVQVKFPTDLPGATAHVAENAFEVTRRDIHIPAGEKLHSGCWHLKSFVDVSDQTRGVAVLNRSVAEYHVSEFGRREIALTLLRATEAVFGNLWGTEGYDIDRFGQGVYEFEYGIHLHEGDWKAARLPELAEAFHTGTVHEVFPRRVMGGNASPSGSLAHVDHPFVQLTTFKKAEGRDAVILHLVNLLDEPVHGELVLRDQPLRAGLVRLDETPMSPLPVSDRIPLMWKSKQVLAVELVFEGLPGGGGSPGFAFPFTSEFVD
ncbi:MAG: glycoside hydrolase family 38 C-terminal domain-containing protein, partial [Verrucomicrobiae bacterium]|nr:glycoside hydrolase family 38 C-terminal domain-containing protein [Verrucomicrobiae bacterium]